MNRGGGESEVKEMNTKVVSVLFAGLILLMAQGAWCDSQGAEEKVYAVQNRIFHSDHEIDFSGGYIADDDFYHVYPIGLGYTYHFNEHISWEVARAQYFITQEKDIQETLKDAPFNAQAEFFNEPIYMLHSHLVYKPLYGKAAILNRKVVNFETYFFAGPGITHYEKNFSTGETESEDAFSLSLGVGFKYFLSKRFCLNFEIRDLIQFLEDDTENNLYFGIGLGYRFNLTPRKIEEDPTMKKLKKILDEK